MNSSNANPDAVRVGTMILAMSLTVVAAETAAFAATAQPAHGTPLLSVSALSIALAAVAIVGAWRQSGWAGWAALPALSWSATMAVSAWTAQRDPHANTCLVAASVAFLMLLWLPAPPLPRVSMAVRAFCLCVAALTTYVAIFGLLFPKTTGFDAAWLPKNFDAALPFAIAIPPLHARFIGSVYLAATVICLLNLASRDWRRGWLPMVAIFSWTGSLLLVSFLHPEAFNWSRSSAWFWYVAYFGFPTTALWILKRAPGEFPTNAPQPSALRLFLVVQAALLAALAAAMLLAPQWVAQLWPWKLPPLLSHIYSAPVGTLALVSLLATRPRGRAAAGIVLVAMLALAVAATVSSLLHRDRFLFSAPAAWVWFAALAVVALASASGLFLSRNSAGPRATNS